MIMTEKVDILDDAPCPRLCHLKKWSGFNGYGFNLHGEKGKAGHFIGRVDPGSPAEAGGLKDSDRIVEVNGANVVSENHVQVVERIKSKPNETVFLVVDTIADQYYKEKKIFISSNLLNVIKLWTPDKPKSGSSMNPRFCYLKTWSDFIGYGFTIQADKDKMNPVIGEVDPESPAENGGLKIGDKLAEVNDIPVHSDIPYQELVKLVKSDPNTVKLLVIEREDYRKFVDLRSQGKYPSDLIEVIKCPDENPRASGKNVTFTFDPSVSSISSNQDFNNDSINQLPNHSTPVRQHLKRTTSNSSSSSNNDSKLSSQSTNQSTKNETNKALESLTCNDFNFPISLKYCEISSTERYLGFGFNLVAEKSKPGNYVDKVEKGSPAKLAGLEDGDYLVAVNNSVVVRENHQEVVIKIKLVPTFLKLIVTDCQGFLQLYERSNRDIEDLIKKTFVFNSTQSPFESKINPNEVTAEVNECSATSKPQDEDSFSIDYKLVAEEMVQLAMKEADQDNIKLNDTGMEPLSKTNQMSPALSFHSIDQSLTNSLQKVKPDMDFLKPVVLNSIQNQNYLSQQSQQRVKPLGPILVGGLEFAATAQEARRKMKKKSDARSTGMSIKDKYELLKRL